MGKIKDRFVWFLARHIERVPYALTPLIAERFDLSRLVRNTDDPLPRRVGFRRIYRPEIKREDGTYRYGFMELTVGRRFVAIQAIKRGNTVKALQAYFRLRKWEVLAGQFGKINKLAFHMAKDLEAREKRDRKLQTPLSEIQRRAGYGEVNSGLFGVIDYVATRNGLKYGEVEGLSDLTLFAILKIDHDKAVVQRREMELKLEEMKRKSKYKKR